jgi:hypothetical protein
MTVRVVEKDYDKWSLPELHKLRAFYERERPQATAHRFYLELAAKIRRRPGAVMWALQTHWRLGPKLNHTGGNRR